MSLCEESINAARAGVIGADVMVPPSPAKLGILLQRIQSQRSMSLPGTNAPIYR